MLHLEYSMFNFVLLERGDYNFISLLIYLWDIIT
jgi:hypothetical protein